jgi:glycerate 2-kinase
MAPASALTSQALAIWRAGVEAVDSARLVAAQIQRNGGRLLLGGESLDLAQVRRILVIGGGKAGAGMAAGVEAALGPDLVDAKVDGWINVPADCVRPLRRIRTHPARPASVNEPTADGVFGVDQIFERVRQLQPDDICLVLLSGGGSALLPAPIDGVSLADKLAVTRRLSQGGATIAELNAVRTKLSRIKGGGLLRAIPAGRVVVLIISDVIGDPLDVIASGPTIPAAGTLDAAEVLRRFVPRRNELPESVWQAVESPSAETESRVSAKHLVIGNNRTALDAAANKARELGFTIRDLGSNHAGVASEVGREFAEACLADVSRSDAPVCLLSGGEPVVKLAATDQPRKGGRNQELVLAAGIRLWNEDLSRLVILSGGTDGEDGPTDAAGAWFDADVRRRAAELELNPHEFLAINNTYPFFAQTGALLLTGPTHTNVMDVRVGLIAGR